MKRGLQDVMTADGDKNMYLAFLPVASETTADLLKRAAVWDILNEVRRHGQTGVTAKQIAENTGHSQSTIYNALQPLWQQHFVERTKKDYEGGVGKSKSRSGGKTPKVYLEPCDTSASFVRDPRAGAENPWGDVIFSRSFNEHVAPKIDRFLEERDQEWTGNPRDILIDAATDFYEEYEGNLGGQTPSGEICDRCDVSHEGQEFLKAVIFYLATSAIGSSLARETLEDLDLAE